MIALQEPTDVPPSAPTLPGDVVRLGDEALDLLPFGVIHLDPSGMVVRYNLAEARFARLDRNQVLGRHFFREIAPCTATPEFEGRVVGFQGGSAPTDRFEYLFDFKFGAQRVDVELVRPPENVGVYVLINRRQLLPARRGLPAGFAAPLQLELAPGEQALGIQRDSGGRRGVTVNPLFFESLRYTWDRMAPRAWAAFCAQWGLQWGRLAVIDLEIESLDRAGQSLRELPMGEMIALLADAFRRQGLGQLAVDFGAQDKGLFIVTLERSALAEAVGRSESPRCQVLGGYLRAAFSHLAQRVLEIREVACKAQGHRQCTFLVAGHGKGPALDAALAAGKTELAAVVASYQGARNG